MSRRLRLLTSLLRLVVRPLLSRVQNPAQARRDFALLSQGFRTPPHVLHLVDSGPVPLHWISVKRQRLDWVILFLHGGGYVVGSPVTHLGLLARLAKLTGLTIASPDYRLAPQHPAPAAFEDAQKAHQRLMDKGFAPDRVILSGDSAGGGLALALLANLCQRGLTPAGLFAFSPWTDLAMTGASLVDNALGDPVFPAARMPEAVAMVKGALDPRDPRISPLYSVFHRPPPVLLQVGDAEILRDDSRRMTAVLQSAGGEVRLEEWPGCPHVWHLLDGYLPEARQALDEVATFVAKLVTRS